MTIKSQLKKFFSKFNKLKDSSPWKINTLYVIGDTVTYNGQSYICIQSHNSLGVWTPDICSSLWNLVSIPVPISPIPDPITPVTTQVTTTETQTSRNTDGGTLKPVA